MGTRTFTFELDEIQAGRLIDYAKNSGYSLSEIANDAFEEYFDYLEADYETAINAVEQMERDGSYPLSQKTGTEGAA